MSIIRLSSPSSPAPTSIDDYEAIGNGLDASRLAITEVVNIIGSNVMAGSIFNIDGSWYYCNSNTAISGSSTRYVRLTLSVDGSTASASFISTGTSITWNAAYNGYYDGSGNRIIFDEYLSSRKYDTYYQSNDPRTKNGIIGKDMRFYNYDAYFGYGGTDTVNDVYDEVAPYLPEYNNLVRPNHVCQATGRLRFTSTEETIIFMAYHVSGTPDSVVIEYFSPGVGGANYQLTLDNGDSTLLNAIPGQQVSALGICILNRSPRE